MQYSAVERLDPHSIFSYVCESERESENKTIFRFKPLSIGEYLKCEAVGREPAVKVGSFALRALQYGLIGWDNFIDEDDGVIPFDLKNIKYLHPSVQIELANEIINTSELEDELSNELKLVAKWGDWIEKHDDKKYQWECEFCIEKKLFERRNCDGTLPKKCAKCAKENESDECLYCGSKTIDQFKFRFSPRIEDFIARCPIAMLTPRAIQLTNIINFTDNSKSLLFSGGAFEQSYFFYMVRMIVLSEQSSLLKRELNQKQDFHKKMEESRGHGRKQRN